MNVFSRIYQHNEWNGIETRSGPGSHREPTRRVADAIVQLVDWLGIESVLDFGCGEGWWMPDLPGYLGVDVAPEAIEVAQRNHPDRQYVVWGAKGKREVFAPHDLIIIRDVIQHLSPREATRIFETAIFSGSKWMLCSTYAGGYNRAIEDGDAYSPNLEAIPFGFGPALLLIHDGYEYHDGDRLRDPAKMLGLWRL